MLLLENSLLVAAVLVAVSTLYFFLLFVQQSFTLRKFKGPTALPLIGNCYDAKAVNFMGFMVRLRKKYGQIFTFYAFTKPYVVVCDPLVVRRILSDSRAFMKGTDYTYQFNAAFGNGLVTSNGEKHKKDRAIFGKYFIRSNVAKLTPLINVLTDDAIEKMLVASDGAPTVHNMEHFFAALSLRVFMMFAIGTDYRNHPAREKDVCEAASKGSFAVGRLITLGLPMWSIIPWVQVVAAIRATVLQDFHCIVSERREKMARNECPELDDCLTAMINENMDEKDMADHYMTLICAGHDTTAYFASYMCYLLAQNPAAQDRLYEEVQSVLGGGGGREEEAQTITADDVTEMRYVQKVMQETLRLYAIIPAVTRVATEEVHIKDAKLTIPQGANIMIPLFLINRDPQIWDNPGEFIPERFEGNSVDFTSAKSGFFPFGYGSRTCIGSTLAQIESCIFVCKLLKRFRFEADPGFRPKINAGISLTTSNGIRIVLVERK